MIKICYHLRWNRETNCTFREQKNIMKKYWFLMICLGVLVSCGPSDREMSEEVQESEEAPYDEVEDILGDDFTMYDYNYMIMLEDNSPLSMAVLFDSLTDFFANNTAYVQAEVKLADDGSILVTKNAWVMTIVYEEGEEVLAESADIANEYAIGRPDFDAITNCSRRLVVYEDEVSDDDFNESIETIHCISRFDGTHIFDALLQEIADDL